VTSSPKEQGFLLQRVPSGYSPHALIRSPKCLCPSGIKLFFMAERIITPITSDGKIAIPKELREKFNLEDYVEIEETHCNKGILIKKL
jgi:AbrB family looped-hinge helix DNA binding protein